MSKTNVKTVKQEFVTVNNLKRFLQNADERFAPNKNMEGIKSDGAGGYVAGKSGLVPAPSSSSNGKFLRSDGTWAAPEVPTKVSELDNDSNFLTSSELSAHTTNENIHVTSTEKTTWNNKQDALTTQQINNINAVPDKANASDLTSHTDDTDIHVTTTEKTTWNNKANKATTLRGYGITDAYTKTQVDKKVSDLVNSAPETLDTLNELASALGNDPNFATTVATQIGTKANNSDVVHKSGNETIAGTKTFSSNIVGNLTGNADTATKATNNASGNKLSNDIIKGLSVNGKVITYTKLDGSTGTITTQDTNTTYSAMSAAEATTGTATTARTITAKVLNDKIYEKISVFSTSNFITKSDGIVGLSVSGKVITYTKGDGSTGTITTQDTNTDTKVTNTLGNTTKAYITGTTSEKTNTGTQIFDSGVYLTTTAGQLHADIDFPITEAQVNEILGIS